MVKSMLKVIGLLTVLFPLIVNAQEGFPQNGVKESHVPMHLVNFNLYTEEGVIEDAEMLIDQQVIVAIGKKVKAPDDAVLIDMNDQYIYPSFVDLNSRFGITVDKDKKPNYKPQLESNKQGPYHWNQAVQPERKSLDYFKADDKKRKSELEKGIGSMLIQYPDGIIRGTSFLYSPTNEKAQKNVLDDEVALHFSLQKGTSKQSYPSSQMGVLALLKQTFLDAKWYAEAQPEQKNVSLEKLNEAKGYPYIFNVEDKLEVLRVLKLGAEQGFSPIIISGGDEYERLEEIKAFQPKLVVPLKFPEPFEVSDPYASKWTTIGDLKEWELAPSNPYFLHQSKIEFAFHFDGLKDWKSIHEALLKVYERGLPEKVLMNALTKNPAKWINKSSEVGQLTEGARANFIVLDQPLLKKETQILQHWINGQKNEIKSKPEQDVRGKYTLNIDAQIYELTIEGKHEKPSGKAYFTFQRKDSLTNEFKRDTAKSKVKIEVQENQISMSASFEEHPEKSFQVHGLLNLDLGIIDGNGKNGNGKWVVWNAIRKEKHKEKEQKTDEVEIDSISSKNIWFPNLAYGFDSLPEAQTYFIKNVTLWTNEEEGIVKNGSVLIKEGVIKKVNGSNAPSDAILIDGTGMHLTPGIIDEHSHIAISKGVNESGQASSAEVSIGDVIRSDDINIYRQLAGGVTTAQLLHGSANPIGGQSAIIKLRWGASPEEMKFKEAPGFIKFALGENVKQSNWGMFNTVRFPQTRMGVEQVYYDAFYRAKAYQKELAGAKKETPVRIDLELQTLSEILDKQRFITCHSYIQSEMNMLMHVADSMGFKVNTFTHVLEGYKIADKLAEHGAGGSTFADWWAYKYEVRDAIPYNAALMEEQGVVVALNSDDAEMGRRLNQEAAKTVKYGGVSEENALKMVTINPAKLLHIDKYVGSIKEGKHADLVLWSGHPLEAKTKAVKTFVDGVLLFDRDQLENITERNEKEKARIIQKMLEDPSKKKKPVVKKTEKHYHCDTIEEIE